ncbi:hypothetical protein FH972_023987 [Carpinus fangiana]|uniref:SET domain-containing protein n=1 Tax=Carpinus fangiana TaxID=176857 RepID=A0A5N6KWQ7_9ROSI|nr:hypothetical protein FH972_023987 [Carpinus fangiana]
MADGMFSVETIEQKGKGACARRAVPRGTLILSEAPLFTVPRLTTRPDDIKKIVISAVQKLDKDSQRSFFALSNNYSNLSCFEGIVKTNAMPLGKDGQQGGLFPLASRFNHSCAANAAYWWNPTVEREAIFAVKDISEGEEITVSYLTEDAWALPCAARRAHLQRLFNFDCVCIACRLSPTETSASDARREKISHMQDAVGNGFMIMNSPERALAYCRDRLELLHLEGEHGPMEQIVYYDAFQICVAHSDFARAKAFAQLCVESVALWQGRDGYDIGKHTALAEQPQSHTLAGHTMRWKSNANRGLSQASGGFQVWLWQRAA